MSDKTRRSNFSHHLAIRRDRVRLPRFVVPCSLALTLIFGLGDTFILSLLSSTTLVVGFYLLWRPGESQILIYAFFYHWLQASLYVFYSAISGVPINSISNYTSNLDKTITLTLFGSICFAAGLRIGAGTPNQKSMLFTNVQIKSTPQRYWFLIYLGSYLTSILAIVLSFFLPGLTQPLHAIADLRWAAFFAFTASSFGNPTADRRLWFAILVFEIISSLGGFFSSFKLAFIFSFLGILASGARLTRAQLSIVFMLVVVALSFGVVWTAIKPQYREYVRGGEFTQTVLVSQSDAVAKIFDLVADLTTDHLSSAVYNLVTRISEIDIFGAAVDYVPAVIPYSDGAIWYESVLRFLVPRMLAPGKAIVDDSLTTNTYTGLRVGGLEEGTQISMGFYADSYVDFGPTGMMLALCAFGMLAGWVYRSLANGLDRRGLIGMSLATVTLFRLESVGFSSAKVLPGLVISLLVYSVLYRVALHALDRADEFQTQRASTRAKKIERPK